MRSLPARSPTALAREQEDAVRADPEVAVAEEPDALRRELERERGLLDDEVVVTERLPFLESHEGAAV